MPKKKLGGMSEWRRLGEPRSLQGEQAATGCYNERPVRRRQPRLKVTVELNTDPTATTPLSSHPLEVL